MRERAEVLTCGLGWLPKFEHEPEVTPAAA
jgi:hypothetical protein